MINTRKIAFQGVRNKKEHRKMPYTPSLIQTILSVPELRRFLLPQQLADYTAGGDFHPALKTSYFVVRLYYILFREKCNHQSVP